MIPPVLNPNLPLASSFHAARVHPASPSGDDGALEAALADFVARGRAAWPGVELEASALAAYLGERAPAEGDAVAWIAEVRAGDMFLACACACGLPAALRAFDAAFLGKMDLYLRALRPTPEVVAETAQILREKLFVGVRGEPPKIRLYEGRGSLEGWVRVSAVRSALNLIASEKAAAPRSDDAEELARTMLPTSDPELALVRARYAESFLAAFREAIASLSPRDRALLRATFLERLTPARVGAMYGVHRTTVMRWIESAHEQLLTRTRAILAERLHVSPSECDRIVSLVKTGIDASLSSLLRTPT
jgi:RNA polymerase sigma-70 factor (ECF subfamily)